MANEIGLYTATPPAAALGVFSGDAFANATTGTYTAISGDTLTKVRVFGRFGSGSGTVDVGLYTFSGGVPVTLVATYTLTFGGTDAWVESGTLSQALSAGTVYTLAIGNPVGGVFSASGVTATNGAANDDTTTLANPWVNARFDGHNFYVAGDISAGSSNTNIQPSAGSAAFTGYAPTVTRTASASITPSVGSLAFTGIASTLTLTIPAPDSGSLALTGYAPTVTVTNAQNIQPSAGALSFAGYAPTVTNTSSRNISPAVGTLTFVGYAPTVTIYVPTRQPSAGSLAFTGYAPSVSVRSPNSGATQQRNRRRRGILNMIWGR